jgi:hypothetical protein
LSTDRTQRSGRRKTPVAHATTSSATGGLVDISVAGTTKPKIIGCVDTIRADANELR